MSVGEAMKRLVLLLLAMASAAYAGGTGISLNRAVFVERIDGAREYPRSIARGDTLLFVVSYQNRSDEPANDVIVVNPVPPSVFYAGSEDEGEEMVSVDGGRTWGRLASLTVRTEDGTTRPARPEDVTHVRWAFARAIGVGEAGELKFRGIVK